MPAYFSLIIELSTETKFSNLVNRFYNALSCCGVKFLKGYWKSEKYSYDEIIDVNQKYLLEPNMKDGSLYQILFDFNKFSEVRGYWNIEKNPIFILLIPEDDFLIYSNDERGSHRERNMESMNKVKNLALSIWERMEVLAIQTCWECSDVAHHFNDIEQGEFPQSEPFAIILEFAINKRWNIDKREIVKDGILIQDDNNWLYL